MARSARIAVVLMVSALAAALTTPATASPDPGTGSAPFRAPVGATPQSPTVERPEMVHHAIPYGAQRRRQMAAYSQRHYGEREWRLEPRGIVQHYTASRSLASVFATFAANSPDPELGELPGVCTHFVIDTDATIYRLTPLRVRCRHTVGLNHRMLGVEHVAMSDAEVMGNKRQLRASLRLSVWLMAKFDIRLGDVIGHNESPRSRFRRELYTPWRCQTHGDFTGTTMQQYRSRLKVRAERYGLDTSRPHWRDNGC